MKNILYLILIVSLTSVSCKKQTIKPYVSVEEETTDTTAWDSGYNNGGTIPNGNGPIVNDLEGTQWVLTKIVSEFSTEYPNDTIDFVSNNEYTLNNGAVRTYQLAEIPSSTNRELNFHYFSPFGGSHYSAQVGLYFVDNGELNNIEFIDIQNTNTTTRAWFIKI